MVVVFPFPSSEVLAIYKMSYMYNAGWGCLITIIVGIVVSLLTGEVLFSLHSYHIYHFQLTTQRIYNR